MTEDMLKKIKSLPPLPESVTKIQQICNNPNSGVSDLIAVVEKDPALTVNLLKAANSPLYGFSREIKTVAQAVSLFGMATVKGFAIASAVRSNFKMDLEPYGISTEQFIRVSELQNSLTVRWFSKINRQMLDILAPTSFLLEIGKVICAEFIKKAAKDREFKEKILNRGEFLGCEGIETLEKEYLQITSEEVAAKIFEHWNFENLMVESIRYSLHPKDAPSEVQKYAIPLFVIKNCINIKEQLTEKNIENALIIIKENGFDEAIFKASLPQNNS